MRLHGTVVPVTGAASGIGRAVSEILVEESVGEVAAPARACSSGIGTLPLSVTIESGRATAVSVNSIHPGTILMPPADAQAQAIDPGCFAHQPSALWIWRAS